MTHDRLVDPPMTATQLADAIEEACRRSNALQRERSAAIVERYAEECRACCDDCGATYDALLIAAGKIREEAH